MFEALLTNRTVSVLWEALPRILTAGLTMTIPPISTNLDLFLFDPVLPTDRTDRRYLRHKL